jgi:hypothetical protein
VSPPNALWDVLCDDVPCPVIGGSWQSSTIYKIVVSVGPPAPTEGKVRWPTRHANYRNLVGSMLLQRSYVVQTP